MGLDAFVDSGKRTLREMGPITIGRIVRIKRHMIQSLVRIRVGKWPAVIPALFHMNELVGRMIIDIRLYRSTVVAPWVVTLFAAEWEKDVVALVYHCPQLIRPG